MKNIEAKYIEKLVDIMKNNELTEVTLEDSDCSLLIKSNGYKPVVKEKTVVQEVVAEPVVEEIVVEEKKNLTPIKSNMIGVFYAKPSPNDKPFVQVGDEIKEGQTICIIETIKLMNKIASDVSGKVVEICIEDGKPVEYGQVIMYVEQ
ncbi:MAG: biotin/lipoyl-binding protein [Candidatus Gastranaerophilales bacterium]|nr:biotin/lipoyl-binding protein [Candidatus Gastranaerophilales bacterium]